VFVCSKSFCFLISIRCTFLLLSYLNWNRNGSYKQFKNLHHKCRSVYIQENPSNHKKRERSRTHTHIHTKKNDARNKSSFEQIHLFVSCTIEVGCIWNDMIWWWRRIQGKLSHIKKTRTVTKICSFSYTNHFSVYTLVFLNGMELCRNDGFVDDSHQRQMKIVCCVTK
jgi:hypothetical protein